MLDWSTVLAVSTIVFGALATVTALGGLAIKEDGRFWELTTRGYASVALLILATISGVANEVITSQQEENLREELVSATAKLDERLEANSRLTEQVHFLMNTPPIELVLEREGNDLVLRNTGRSEVSDLRIKDSSTALSMQGLHRPRTALRPGEFHSHALLMPPGFLSGWYSKETDGLWAISLDAYSKHLHQLGVRATDRVLSRTDLSDAESLEPIHPVLTGCLEFEASAAGGSGGVYKLVARVNLGWHRGDISTAPDHQLFGVGSDWLDVCNRAASEIVPTQIWLRNDPWLDSEFWLAARAVELSRDKE